MFNPISARPDRIDAPLYIVTAIANPHRFRSRWSHYYNFARHVAAIGAKLLTVEVAYGERAFAVTTGEAPTPAPGRAPSTRQLQLRTRSILWHKENALNLGFSRLPSDWKYAAWVDADLVFLRPDVVEATLHALQHHPIVQMWSRGLDLNPEGHAFAQYRSFADSHLRFGAGGQQSGAGLQPPYGQRGYWHSGYAWAITREAFDAVGGLIDFAVLGAADYFMAWALIGELGKRLYSQLRDRQRAARGYSPGYVAALVDWERRARALDRNVGCVAGTVAHHWHGKKLRRAYNVRENILIDCRFDPQTDLKRDWQGLWQLRIEEHSLRQIALRDRVRQYFQARDEDATDHDSKEIGTA